MTHKRALHVGNRDADNYHDTYEFLPCRHMHRARQDLQAGVRVAQQLVNEDESDIPNQNKCRMLEDREFFDEPNTRSRHEPESKNPNENTGADNPELRTHGDGRNNIIHAQAEIHDLDCGNRPEESTLGYFGNVRAF